MKKCLKLRNFHIHLLKIFEKFKSFFYIKINYRVELLKSIINNNCVGKSLDLL